MFPNGPPIQYWPGPVTVNFGVRKRSGVFVTVWPLANKELRNAPTRTCYTKDLQKKSKVSFSKISKYFFHTQQRCCALNTIDSPTEPFFNKQVRTNHNHFSTNKLEQIIGTQDKPQCLVAQRLLSHLQYLDATKSSTKDLSPSPSNIVISWQ